jgi:hypothetical protein
MNPDLEALVSSDEGGGYLGPIIGDKKPSSASEAGSPGRCELEAPEADHDDGGREVAVLIGLPLPDDDARRDGPSGEVRLDRSGDLVDGE